MENSNQIFIDGIITKQTFNTYYPYEVIITPFYWTGFLVRFKVESGGWCQVTGGNPALYFNGFENYFTHVLIPPNIESGETEINIVSDKHQYKDKFIVNNRISNIKWNQITD